MKFIAKILIVDDMPENIGVLFELLNQEHYEILVAQTGESAIEIALSEQPDLILLDVMMPNGMDGFQTCDCLKSQESCRYTPIIFMTALSDVEDKVHGFKLGAVDYIIKPFQQDEVLARIHTHLTLRQLQQQLQQQNDRLRQEIEARKEAEIALLKANRTLQQLATLDGLTLLANRRRFDEYLQQSWRQMLRDNKSLSLLFCDIDFFKLYNDAYGHVAGDDCLKRVAMALSETTYRPADLVARYGGEEFIFILPDTPPAGALHVAKRAQHRVASLHIPHQNSVVSQWVTLSIGISGLLPSRHNSANQLLDCADQAVYLAKKQGRNQIVTKNLSDSLS
jgi:diguanylate cyclase (GGDEF)-like protein